MKNNIETSLKNLDLQSCILFSYAEKNNDLKLYRIFKNIRKEINELYRDILLFNNKGIK